ncbi:MAG TPA: ABC transporter ATP-binding protein [Candidatus Obscuribacterales bacterium]
MLEKPTGSHKQTLVSKFNRAIAQLLHLPRAFDLVWAAAPKWTVAWVILLIVQGILPAATVYLTKVVVDSLVAAMKAGASWESVQIFLIPVAFMGAILVLKEALQGALTWIRTVQAELMQDYISGLIHEKAVVADIAFYESSDYHDKLERARSDASTRSLGLLENSGSLLQNSITLVAMAAVLIPYGAWLPLALLVSMLPALGVVLGSNREYHQWWQQTTPDRRWTQYYDMMLTHSGVAPELRLFNLGPYFQSAYKALRQRLVRERLRLIKKQSLAQLVASASGLLVSAATMAWIVWRALKGEVTLGGLALFYQAFNQGQSLMRTLLGNVGQIYTNSLFLGNLFEFLRLEPQVVDPPEPLPVPSVIKEGICFRQVSFRYPGGDRVALGNFNLTIPAGKIVAIVGDNGAGKTTLVKLLCRFYDPESGCIEIDGIDLRKLSVQKLRRLLTVLFQFPINYHATVAESIAKGDLEAQPSAAEIETAAKGAGAHDFITRLPQGYDTLLGQWFATGTNLSGGELQRIALARSFVRQAQIIVLDEPTSAMDSWAEVDWLNKFRTLANGRTALVITHRFTLAMRADIIHVMRNGRIVESGSHHELVEQGGFYSQSWKAQVQTDSNPPIVGNLS